MTPDELNRAIRFLDPFQTREEVSYYNERGIRRGGHVSHRDNPNIVDRPYTDSAAWMVVSRLASRDGFELSPRLGRDILYADLFQSELWNQPQGFKGAWVLE